MNLSRRFILSLIAIAFTACTDSLKPSAFAGAYGLSDINGRPLPTYEAPTPGLTLTVNRAGLAVDFANTAELIRDVTQFNGARDTVTTSYTYRIKGHDLIFTCAGPVDCISQPTGTITSTGDIDLDMGSAEFPIVYHFKRITVAY